MTDKLESAIQWALRKAGALRSDAPRWIEKGCPEVAAAMLRRAARYEMLAAAAMARP